MPTPDFKSEHATETWTYKIALIVIVLAVLTALILIGRHVHADTVTLRTLAPTHYKDGSALTLPHIIAFDVYRAPGPDGPFIFISSLPFGTVIDAPNTPHCYKLLTVDDEQRRALLSDATPVCVTKANPAPKRITVDTNAYRVSTNYATFKFVRGSLSGKVALAVPCESRTTGDDYYYVPKSRISALPGISKPDYSVVKCSVVAL